MKLKYVLLFTIVFVALSRDDPQYDLLYRAAPKMTKDRIIKSQEMNWFPKSLTTMTIVNRATSIRDTGLFKNILIPKVAQYSSTSADSGSAMASLIRDNG
jgi:hypothetical protein